MLHFVAFFHVASLLSTRIEKEKVRVDNEKAVAALFFHRVDNEKGQQNIFFIFQPDFNIKISPKNATKYYILLNCIPEYSYKSTMKNEGKWGFCMEKLGH